MTVLYEASEEAEEAYDSPAEREEEPAGESAVSQNAEAFASEEALSLEDREYPLVAATLPPVPLSEAAGAPVAGAAQSWEDTEGTETIDLSERMDLAEALDWLGESSGNGTAYRGKPLFRMLLSDGELILGESGGKLLLLNTPDGNAFLTIRTAAELYELAGNERD